MTTSTATDRWIAYRKPQADVRLRLFCCHYAGGGAAVFRAWQQQVPAGVEVCPVQLPGRESRLKEPALTDVPSIVEALSEAIRPLLDLPFAFFGHSMGAILSFETAHHLRGHGLPEPVYLMLSGRRAPHRPETQPDISQLPDDEFRDELRRLEGTPEEVLAHEELMELLTPLLRADFTVCETYSHEAALPLSCTLAACGGLDDERVDREDVAAWERYTSGEFRLRMYPGGHFFLNEGSKAALHRALADDLSRELSRF